jgi:hypothetical protein
VTETQAKGQRTVTLALPNPITATAILLGVAAFVVYAVTAFGGYFGHDDFVILYRAHNGSPIDGGYLFQDYSGHFAPGMFLVAWIVTTLAPLSHPVAIIPLLLMQIGAMALMWRLLVRCFTKRWVLLLPFTAFAFSPLILFPTLWWAYGIQLFPLLLTMVGALNTHVTYLRTRRMTSVVHTLLWTAAGLAFYEKAALFVVLLFGITLLLGERVTWRVWLAHGALVAVFAVLFTTLTASQVKDTGVQDGFVGEFLRRALFETFLPGVFGGSWTASGDGATVASPPLGVQIVFAVLALLVIAGGIRAGGRRAIIAWSLLAGYLAVDLALVIVTRLPEIGPLIGNDPRYVADAVPVAILCATFAFLRKDSGELSRPLTLGLVVLVAISATISFLRLAPGLQFVESREFVATAGEALRAEPGIVLYDAQVPGKVMLDWFTVDGKASRVLGLLPAKPKFDEPGEVMHLLDSGGTPRPIKSVSDAVFSKPGPVQDCGYPVDYQAVSIPLSGRTDGRKLLRMEYYTSAAGPATVHVGRTSADVPVKQGLHVLYLVVDDSFDKVDINRATQVAPMCVVNIRVGMPSTN